MASVNSILHTFEVIFKLQCSLPIAQFQFSQNPIDHQKTLDLIWWLIYVFIVIKWQNLTEYEYEHELSTVFDYVMN